VIDNRFDHFDDYQIQNRWFIQISSSAPGAMQSKNHCKWRRRRYLRKTTCFFEEMDKTKISQLTFRLNGNRLKGIRSHDDSVERRSTKRFLVKWHRSDGVR
jgi:hypothetical protein